MNTDLLSTLRCMILPGAAKHCPPEFYDYYDAAYECWKVNVTDGLRSERHFDRALELKSDNFYRHDEVIGLFQGKTAVGVFPCTWFALTRQAILDHSYFKVYPEHVVKRLKSESHQLMMGLGTLTVQMDWRKSVIGIGVS